MPGIDFVQVQAMVPMVTVLRMVRFVPRGIGGDQLHCPCPVHRSKSPRPRSTCVGKPGWRCPGSNDGNDRPLKRSEPPS